ncbi:MAG: Wzy polymerase domain-containing protein [Amphritea sp.]|nr:Wzy polymerase domain-containing protein [Amphritea sp.]
MESSFLSHLSFSSLIWGGEGLSVSHNTTVWIAATLFTTVAVFMLFKTAQFRYPRNWFTLLAMPASVIACGFLVDIFLPYQFLLRELYILGGLFFLFALFQFKFSTSSKESLLFILMLGGVLHALYGVSQIFWPGFAPEVITYSTGTPYSTFQQINLQASYQATVLLITLYLLSRRGVTQRGTLQQLLIFSAVLLSSFIIAYSGSRVGVLSGLAGLVIIFVCRWRQLMSNKFFLVVFFALIATGSMLGKSGLASTGVKLQKTAEENLRDVRKNIYAVAVDLFIDQPIQGYGIGSFQKEWHKEKVNYLTNNPDADFPADRLSHPHNELMFWIVEGGLLVIAGILISLGAVITSALKCGWRKGVTYLALLLPIGLHTQVELPFYISNIHWFMMMTLVFLTLSHNQSVISVNLSNAAIKLTKATTVSVFTLVTVFMIHSIRANDAIIQFFKNEGTQPIILKSAMNNPFFKDQAELYFMRAIFTNEINKGNPSFAPKFIEWAEPFIEYTPVPQLHIDLAQAYLIVGEEDKAFEILNRGRSIYPRNKFIKQAEEYISQASEDSTESPQAAPALPQATQAQ